MNRVILGIAVLVLTTASVYSADVRVRFYSKYVIKDAVITGSADKNLKCMLTLKNGLIHANYSNGDRQKALMVRLFNGMPAEYAVETAGQKRIVPGAIDALILPGEKGIVLVSTMDIEDYVPCVLASELEASLYKPELAKAHAIVIRTFATFNNKRHRDYDFCDLTHCEVFKGKPLLHDMWYGPVEETKGIIMAGPCAKEAVYFSGCCGGFTENAGEFASGRAGKCGKSIKDVLNGRNLCEGHRYFRWIKHINRGQVENALASFVDEKRPEVKDVKVSARTAAGRVKKLDFTYLSGGAEKRVTLDINKYFSVFGKQAGWALIPSKWFDIRKEGNGFVLTGHGHGHGVGLCLQGASSMAGMGKTYREILRFYFPGFKYKPFKLTGFKIPWRAGTRAGPYAEPL